MAKCEFDDEEIEYFRIRVALAESPFGAYKALRRMGEIPGSLRFHQFRNVIRVKEARGTKFPKDLIQRDLFSQEERRERLFDMVFDEPDRNVLYFASRLFVFPEIVKDDIKQLGLDYVLRGSLFGKQCWKTIVA